MAKSSYKRKHAKKSKLARKRKSKASRIAHSLTKLQKLEVKKLVAQKSSRGYQLNGADGLWPSAAVTQYLGYVPSYMINAGSSGSVATSLLSSIGTVLNSGGTALGPMEILPFARKSNRIKVKSIDIDFMFKFFQYDQGTGYSSLTSDMIRVMVATNKTLTIINWQDAWSGLTDNCLLEDNTSGPHSNQVMIQLPHTKNMQGPCKILYDRVFDLRPTVTQSTLDSPVTWFRRRVHLSFPKGHLVEWEEGSGSATATIISGDIEFNCASLSINQSGLYYTSKVVWENVDF
nr:MAG: capsid protein [Cressdnaviricota sp.]